MTRQEKTKVIDELKQKFEDNPFFYLTDSSTLTVAEINQFRRKCFENGIEMRVIKNTLARKALEATGEEKAFDGLFESLKGPTSILFTKSANVPAKIIEEFRKKRKKPVLKAAYIDKDVYIGDDQIKTLSSLKSKEELIADIVLILQSPIKNVLRSLQSGGQTIAGILKAIEEKTKS